jgi:hypothetical protein
MIVPPPEPKSPFKKPAVKPIAHDLKKETFFRQNSSFCV